MAGSERAKYIRRVVTLSNRVSPVGGGVGGDDDDDGQSSSVQMRHVAAPSCEK